ncbi:MAG: ATP-binding cassette domain-containing protein [Bacilli bacterium]|nr:ATP-binding cassette domain-containing protein [Bacilli bacterium]
MNLIELKNLTLGYDNHIVLKSINMSIDDGDFICVVGPNGSGKSTLIKGILGLIKPISGKVIYNNLKQNFIGYMPQETLVDKNFPASVYEIVLSGTLNTLTKSFYTKKEKDLVLSNMKLLGIEKLKDKNFCDLSGGERQKVLLARSLCSTSKLLILDEPSNNLDSKSKKDLYETVINLNKKNNITIIMITHDLDHDNLIGNKILSLREDEIFFGTTKEFVRRVHHE